MGCQGNAQGNTVTHRGWQGRIGSDRDLKLQTGVVYWDWQLGVNIGYVQGKRKNMGFSYGQGFLEPVVIGMCVFQVSFKVRRNSTFNSNSCQMI